MNFTQFIAEQCDVFEDECWHMYPIANFRTACVIGHILLLSSAFCYDVSFEECRVQSGSQFDALVKSLFSSQAWYSGLVCLVGVIDDNTMKMFSLLKARC